jgi:DNA-binding response OmpR family regulator
MGQVLSRDQLMNTIKGRDWECYDRAVDGLVSRLRRKLSVREVKNSYIRTVPGVGYRFAG